MYDIISSNLQLLVKAALLNNQLAIIKLIFLKVVKKVNKGEQKYLALKFKKYIVNSIDFKYNPEYTGAKANMDINLDLRGQTPLKYFPVKFY